MMSWGLIGPYDPLREWVYEYLHFCIFFKSKEWVKKKKKSSARYQGGRELNTRPDYTTLVLHKCVDVWQSRCMSLEKRLNMQRLIKMLHHHVPPEQIRCALEPILQVSLAHTAPLLCGFGAYSICFLPISSGWASFNLSVPTSAVSPLLKITALVWQRAETWEGDDQNSAQSHNLKTPFWLKWLEWYEKPQTNYFWV